MSYSEKFDSAIAEELYGLVADDECGNPDAGIWFGLYEEEGVILYQDSMGFVYTIYANGEKSLLEKWEDICSEWRFEEDV